MPVVESNRFIVTAPRREAVEALLKGAAPEGRIVDELPLVDGYVVEVPDDVNLALFKSLPPGVDVTPDNDLHWILPEEMKKPPSERAIFKLNTAPQTLGMTEVWNQGFTGKGVGVALLDSGTHPHKDFEGRLVFKDFVDPSQDGKPHDEAGHGTHVAGDAAGSGAASGGKYKGAAPDATILGLKIGGEFGPSMTAVIKAVDWAIQNKERYNIRVMNMSFGGSPDGPADRDPVNLAIKKAYDNGIVTVVAAGNDGPARETVGSPGNSPFALTVGASDDRGTVQTSDDRLARFSSRGPTPEGLAKPDVVGPGVNIMAPQAGTETEYVSFSGTSMASPITAGVLATWFQANPDLTPAEAIRIARETARPLNQSGLTPNDQGNGHVDAAAGLKKVLGQSGVLTQHSDGF